MLIKPSKCLMNEEDASPGNGQATPAPAAAPANQGSSNDNAPAFPVDAIKQVVSAAIAEALPMFKNAVHADLRKAGVYDKDKPVKHPDPAPAPQQAPGATNPAAASGLSVADVESMLERERVIERAATRHGLTDAQRSRMKAALVAEKPESIASWADSYLTDMGLVKAATPASPNPNTNNKQPESAPTKPAGHAPNLAPSTAPDTTDPELIWMTQPEKATSHDRDRLIAKVGRDKALEIIQRGSLARLKQFKVVPDNRRR